MSKRKGDPGYAANWCIHYRASMEDHETCEAGVNYKQAFPLGADGKAVGRWPCFMRPIGNPSLPVLQCANLRPPTPEEIEAHDKWVNAHFEKIRAAQEVIFPYRKTHRGKGVHEIECPNCKGKLLFSIAAYNGHCRARCETEGCVAWME